MQENQNIGVTDSQSSNSRVEFGEVVRLSPESRRSFLKKVVSGGAVGTSLLAAIDETTGLTPEGKPLVLTRDGLREPRRVKMVEEERYRRLSVFKRMNKRTFIRSHPTVDGVSITQLSSEPTDLAIQLELNTESNNAASSLPDQISDVPVQTVYKPTETTPKCDTTTSQCSATSDNDSCRTNEEVSEIEGNIEVAAEDKGAGTVTVVGWNDDENDQYPAIVTADHVMEGASTMYQPRKNQFIDGQKAGEYRTRDQSLDATKYESTMSVNHNATAESNQASITGVWTSQGLADQTSGTGTVSCAFAGAQTCYCETECENTSSNSSLEVEADMKNVVTEQGDSGGPFVDSSGNLVCALSGCQHNDSETKFWDIGPVGDDMLKSVNVLLADPDLKY